MSEAEKVPQPKPAVPSLVLGVLFFLSGASALLFETLWFRLAGLVVGNNVWTSGLVLASFMGGLALGSAWAVRRGADIRRPLRAYALLEATVGITGLGLVLLFPLLTEWLGPVFRPFAGRLLVLNALRLTVVFMLLLVPCLAMGLTLPVLVKAAAQRSDGFGRVLGRLYGWNTFGATVGALASEAFLIERLGIRGTGVLAALLNVLVAVVVLSLGRRADAAQVGGNAPRAPAPPSPLATPAPKRGGDRPGLLAAAFLSGGILLALEVVWFRFLLLFVGGTKVAFAAMLAVVLAGIAGGGWLAAAWLRHRADAHRFLPSLALTSGVLTVVSYAGFDRVLAPYGNVYIGDLRAILLVSAGLMLPVCVLSGLLFTLLGGALKQEDTGETETVGALTLANTTGGLVGALLAGFVLLPRWGIERSVLALALTYGAVALATFVGRSGALEPERRRRVESVALAGCAALFVFATALFPFGLMLRRYLPITARRYGGDGSRVVAVREGLLETVIYMRRDLWGEPVDYRLLTNGFSMSGSSVFPRRYMGLFAYWPLVLHPQPRSALLISFGVGSTAKALTSAPWLTSIDVVDPSQEILEMSVIPHPAGSPLRDPRVRLHLEDGRFFLLTTELRFDIITGEPPPPKNADIVNLYTREYFELMRSRLNEGGMATYWLPVPDMLASDSKAVIRAFCEAFDDCSLWAGAEWDWMLVGSRGAGAVSQDSFERPWRVPALGDGMRAIAIELPEQLGATFLGDADFLRPLTRDTPPLTDNWPYRLSRAAPERVDPFHVVLMDESAAQSRFAGSAFIKGIWPAAVRERTLAMFGLQRILTATYSPAYGRRRRQRFADLHESLAQANLFTLPLWIMDSHEDEQRAAAKAQARGVSDPILSFKLGVRSLAERDYQGAQRWFARAQQEAPQLEEMTYWRTLALLLANDRDGARQIADAARLRVAPERADLDLWAWMAETFSFESPYAR